MKKIAAAIITVLIAGGLVVSNGLLFVKVKEQQQLINRQEDSLLEQKRTISKLESQKDSKPKSGESEEENKDPLLPKATLPNLKELMGELLPVVEEYRVLTFKTGVNFALVSQEELTEYLIEIFPTVYTEEQLAQDELFLRSFFLVKDNFDLKKMLLDVYGQGTAGLYDDVSKKLFVVDIPQSSFYREMTMIHELTHALEDQHFDLREHLDRIEESGTTDEAMAFMAVAEGSAMVTMTTYLENNPLRSLALVGDAIREQQLAGPLFNKLPNYLLESFMFPYNDGEAFVRAYLSANTDHSIDDLYANPPRSTTEILHPERYPRSPLPIVTGKALPNPWTLALTDSLGEWGWSTILSEYIDHNTVYDTMSGWQTDSIEIWTHNTSTVVRGYASFQEENQANLFYQFFSGYLNDHDEVTYLFLPDATTVDFVFTTDPSFDLSSALAL